MHIVYKSESRGLTNIEWLKSYHTFSFGNYFNRNRMGFGALRVINDDIVDPNRGFDTHPHKNMEIITYVLSGELTHQDSLGTSEVLKPGEVQRMSAGSGILHSEHNKSKNTPVHLLQIWIVPKTMNIHPRYNQQVINYDSELSLVVSRDGRNGSLQIEQDADCYALKASSGSNVLLPHQSLESGWVHIIEGKVKTWWGEELSAGDSFGFYQEDAKLNLQILESTHALVFSLPALD
jgi:redox-sensitive bicupin YhaK (pirin superfamily)